MLVLSRKPGETIVINNEITIMCCHSTNKGQIKFAVSAPKNMTIHRGEIQDRLNNGEKWTKE